MPQIVNQAFSGIASKCRMTNFPTPDRRCFFVSLPGDFDDRPNNPTIRAKRDPVIAQTVNKELPQTLEPEPQVSDLQIGSRS